MKKLLFTFYFTLFTFLCGAQYTTLLTFKGANGEFPIDGLILSGNILYGMTGGGGVVGDTLGNVFSIHTDGTDFKQLLVFNGSNGSFPSSTLLLPSGGKTLYGLTNGGGYPGVYGNIFSIDTDGANYKNLHVFNDTAGGWPGGIMAIAGNILYGAASGGGMYNNGCIFSIHTDGTGYKDIFDFGGNNGSGPQGVILLGNILCGMTTYGGIHGYGCIFSVDTIGNGYKDIYNFGGGSNGSQPFGNLTFYDKKFYGMTVQGGATGYGNIFSIDTNGSNYKDIFDFNGTDGQEPFGTLIYSGGVLYGTAQHGGADSNGCIFSIDTDGNGYKDLYDFTIYGEIPDDLVLSGDMLYGMANNAAGRPNFGVLFSFKDTNGDLGVNELKGESGIVKVYPNPSNGQFNFVIASETKQSQSTIEVYNELGQQVYSNTIVHRSSFIVDLSNQPNGMYFYRAITNTGSLIGEGKVVIEK